MFKKIKLKLDEYTQLNDVQQYETLLTISTDFIQNTEGIDIEDDILDLGMCIIRELATLNYLGALHQYENDYDLHKRIRHTQIKVFKNCIPPSHAKLRGLTELLMGMKENAVG